MPVSIENDSWDYVQGLIEKEINSAFKLRMPKHEKQKFPKDHPYMKRLDKVLKHYFVVKVSDVNGAEHGEDFEEMKEVILDALFLKYLGQDIRK